MRKRFFEVVSVLSTIPFYLTFKRNVWAFFEKTWIPFPSSRILCFKFAENYLSGFVEEYCISKCHQCVFTTFILLAPPPPSEVVILIHLNKLKSLSTRNAFSQRMNYGSPLVLKETLKSVFLFWKKAKPFFHL